MPTQTIPQHTTQIRVVVCGIYVTPQLSVPQTTTQRNVHDRIVGCGIRETTPNFSSTKHDTIQTPQRLCGLWYSRDTLKSILQTTTQPKLQFRVVVCGIPIALLNLLHKARHNPNYEIELWFVGFFLLPSYIDYVYALLNMCMRIKKLLAVEDKLEINFF
jgi:hypothetical protein